MESGRQAQEAVVMHATVRDAMTTNAVAGKDTPFKDMAAMPHGYRARAFPLLDERGMVIRVVSEVGLPAKEALNGTVPGRVVEVRARLSYRRPRAGSGPL